MKLAEIESLMQLLDAPADRLQALIDLALQLPPYPEEVRDEAHRVEGCVSKVWLEARFAGEPARLELVIDSDALVVQGLAALVHASYDQRTPQEILDFDFDGLLRRLGLEDHISPQRRNGLTAVVARLRSLAHAARAHAD